MKQNKNDYLWSSWQQDKNAGPGASRQALKDIDSTAELV